MSTIRPREVCQALLAALEAAEGRRRSRKRDQTPDAIGLGIKRGLLDYPRTCAPELSGAVTAMAHSIFDEWRLAHSLGDFKAWLDRGAPSEDAFAGKDGDGHDNVRAFR